MSQRKNEKVCFSFSVVMEQKFKILNEKSLANKDGSTGQINNGSRWSSCLMLAKTILLVLGQIIF